MRHRRSTRYLPTLLTVAVGVVAVPAHAGAQEEPTPSSDEASATPEPPAADTSPPAPAPPAADPAPTTEPVPPATPTGTTVPEPIEEVTPSSAPSTAPQAPPTTAATEADDTAMPEASAPATPEVAPAPPSADTPATGHPAPADDDELDVDSSVVLPDGEVRTIAFPVLGPVQFANDWGNCRAGCTRRHQGNDMIGTRMQPLLAAVDGTVTRVRYENVGTAGAVITITGADGWYYNYFHLNNDAPGTDDGAAANEWQISPQLTIGSRVRAGQVIAYLGDSGNAEGSVPHLHFEIRRPDRTPVNPYRSLVAAQRRAACADGRPLLVPDAATLSPAVVAVIPLDGGGRWLIDADGRVFAEGSAARIAGADDATCDDVAPAAGPDAAGLAPSTAPVAAAVAPDVAPVGADTPTPSAPASAAGSAPEPDLPPADRLWTVARGESLWTIVRAAYGATDDAGIVTLVQTVFEHNRDVVTDPDLLGIGLTLRLPPIV